MLVTHQDIIKSCLPSRWEQCKSTPGYQTAWTRRELSIAFGKVVTVGLPDHRFCFFIDGLDEFAGQHLDLVQDLQTLSSSPTVKLCVASRPWNLFRSVYGASDALHLKLHELTKQDIDIYLNGMLNSNELKKRASGSEQDYEGLLRELRYRAEGVFLWVNLAVKSLRGGLGEGDSIVNLRERVETFPSELEDFLQHIFDTVEPVYRMWMARILLLMVKSENGCPLLWPVYVELEGRMPDTHLSIQACQSPKTLSGRISNTPSTLSASGAGICYTLIAQ